MFSVWSTDTNVLLQNMSSYVRSPLVFCSDSLYNELFCVACAVADLVAAETQDMCQNWCEQLIRVMNPDPQRGLLGVSAYLWGGPFWCWYYGTWSTWDTLSITNKTPITFPTFRPESTEAWIIILATGMYVNIVHISCIQGCVCVLLGVFFIILWPLAMFNMLQCLICFSLFWTCTVLWHVPWLQF
jgi:hypothetical protein